MNVPCISCEGLNKEWYQIDITNELYYEFVCINGHLNAFSMQSEKFELFLIHGLTSYNNDQRMETIFKLNLALEEFHKFCIKIFLRKNNISFSNIAETYKKIVKRSEQINGAFYSLYLNAFDCVPDDFMERMSNFRNKLIHNGYFPTKSETDKYAKDVFNYIKQIINKLKKEHQAEIWDVIAQRVIANNKKGVVSNLTPLLLENDGTEVEFDDLIKLAGNRYSF